MTPPQQSALFPLPNRPEARRLQPGYSRDTIESYEYDFAAFERFCAQRDYLSLPAPVRVVIEYVLHLAKTNRPMSITRTLYALRAKHIAAGHFPSPTDADAVRGVLRQLANEDQRASEPQRDLNTAHLEALLDALYATDPQSEREQLARLRNHALLLLYFSGALLRDEARTLTFENMRVGAEGVFLTVNASEFRNRAREVLVLAGERERTDPVRALARWIAEARITGGPVFRRVYANGMLGEEALSRSYASHMWAEWCVRAKLNPKKVSPQSFRRGFVVQAFRGGATVAQIMSQTGHRDADRVVQILKAAGVWANHPGRRLNL